MLERRTPLSPAEPSVAGPHPDPLPAVPGEGIRSVAGMRLAFAGAGAFGVPTLRRLVDAGAEIVAVYTLPDRPAGRGKKLTPTPLAEAADTLGLNVVRTADLNAEALPAVDALVVIAFGQKIAANVTTRPRLGAINLHASLLPKYRGAAPIHAAVLAGETVVGNSVIRLAEKMDAGAVLGTSGLAVGPTETTGELHDRLAAAGAPLVERVLEQLRAGQAVELPQDHGRATLARKLSRETTRIDFAGPARRIADQIRGLYPWPGCRARVLDGDAEIGRLTLIRARVGATGVPPESAASENTGVPPVPLDFGVVRADGTIACGDGAVEILELQPEGKRPMTLTAYRNGRPWTAGLRIESVV